MALPDFSKAKPLAKSGQDFQEGTFELEIVRMRLDTFRTGGDYLAWDMRILASSNPLLPTGVTVSDMIGFGGASVDVAPRIVAGLLLVLDGKDANAEEEYTDEFLTSINATLVEMTSEAQPAKGAKLRAICKMGVYGKKSAKAGQPVLNKNYFPHTPGVPGGA